MGRGSRTTQDVTKENQAGSNYGVVRPERAPSRNLSAHTAPTSLPVHRYQIFDKM